MWTKTASWSNQLVAEKITFSETRNSSDHRNFIFTVHILHSILHFSSWFWCFDYLFCFAVDNPASLSHLQHATHSEKHTKNLCSAGFCFGPALHNDVQLWCVLPQQHCQQSSGLISITMVVTPDKSMVGEVADEMAHCCPKDATNMNHLHATNHWHCHDLNHWTVVHCGLKCQFEKMLVFPAGAWLHAKCTRACSNRISRSASHVRPAEPQRA